MTAVIVYIHMSLSVYAVPQTSNSMKELIGMLTENVLTSTSTPTVSGGSTQGCLQWRDMLVVSWYPPKVSRMIAALKEADIPVQIIENDADIEDVAMARSDVVWLMTEDQARGLEKKVVVFVQLDPKYGRVHYMSRCTSQLVIVSDDLQRSVPSQLAS